MTNELFIRCECGAEGVNIVLDDETGDVFFSIFRYGKQDMSIMHKLSWIRQVIKGDPYLDEVVIGRGYLPLLIDKLRSMIIEGDLNEQKESSV